MDIFRRYIFSVICASIISGVMIEITRKTFFHKQMNIVCGIFVLLSMVAPLVNWQWSSFSIPYSEIRAEANVASEAGEHFRIQSISGIIKEQCEAYILKEASSCGAHITVQITMDYIDTPRPTAVTIQGSFDASCETKLSRVIAQELGIPKEHQTWIRKDINSSSSF